MKKQITAMLLSALLLTNAAACDITPNNPEQETESTLEETTTAASISTKIHTEKVSLSQINAALHHDLPKASLWTDETGEEYVYIKEWKLYRHMPELSSYHSIYLNDNCIVIHEETATIAVIHQHGKHDEPTIITYHFNKDDEKTEFYATPLNVKASSEYDTFFVNMHDADHGYYFLTPIFFESGIHEWPLFMFETTDGGKSWNQISTNNFNTGSGDHINILEFASPRVGILSFRDLGATELFDRTYLTVDGGLTWNQLPQLPRVEVVEWYSEVIDFEYVEDCNSYYLTVKAHNSDCRFQIQFWSKDLINWELN